MATNVGKALYAMPGGLADAESPQEDLQVIIEPEEGEEELGAPAEGSNEVDPQPFDKNLMDDIEPGLLATLQTDMIKFFDDDVRSRKEWLDTYVEGLKILGLKYEERMEPWKGACGVFHPLLMEAAVRFQSENIVETFPASGPVRTKIIGKETPEKRDAAKRVEEDMNYQLTEVMQEYRSEHDRLLISLCLSGNSFKKIYKDARYNRQVSLFVAAEDVVVPYGASNLQTAERITHIMRKTKFEFEQLQATGFYDDVELGDPVKILTDVEKVKQGSATGANIVYDDRYMFLEMQLHYVPLTTEDEKSATDDLPLPYIVTIERGSQRVVRVCRNWLEKDDTHAKRDHFVHYEYIPGFGFYAFGLIHLVGGHATAATSITRQLVDAGTLSNLPGGMKTKGMRIKGDDTPISPGEFRDVDVPSGTLRDNLLPLPYKEPSVVLLNLLDKLVEDGRRFASTADLDVSDMSAQAPVGTTMALLERQLKVMSAVQARVHASMKQEFKLLVPLIRETAPTDYNYDPDTDPSDRKAKQSDYSMVEVIPVSDPNAATMSQRIVQYQAALQLSSSNPAIYNQPFLHRQMLEVLGIKNAAKIVPLPEDMRATDPVTENMNILMNKPVKAFLYQDHASHLTVHISAIQDPMIQQAIAQNLQGPQIQAAAMAHVMEHLAYQYRMQIQEQLGGMLPAMPSDKLDDDEQPMTPQEESQVAALAAMAAPKLLQSHQATVAQQQAQQQAQDPLVQLEQEELQIKKGELQRKSMKDLIDASVSKDRLDLERAKLGVDISKDKASRQMDAVKTGVDIAKDHAARQADMLKHKLGIGADAVQHGVDTGHKAAQHLTGLHSDLLKHVLSLQQKSAESAQQRQHEVVNKPKPTEKK